MQLLLVEDLTSGALALDVPDWLELADEGAAMLHAIGQDARDVPGWRVEVLWSDRLGRFPVPGVTAHVTDSPERERRLFRELAKRADRTFVIAPEFDRRLERRRETVETAGGCFVGSTAAALALCGDKFRLAGHLQERGIPTIPTRLFDPDRAEEDLRRVLPDGLIIKPRDGAGAMNTFHVRDAEALRRAAAVFDEAGAIPILQPFLAGRAISVAAIVARRGVELFPPAAQHLQYGERLTYCGGSVGELHLSDILESVVRSALDAVPGLRGYIGVDLIVPDRGGPVVVEINPRLTTSYLGYRRLAGGNLAPRIMDPDGDHPPIAWRSGRVGFGTSAPETARGGSGPVGETAGPGRNFCAGERPSIPIDDFL